jgi:hypothetical protein
VPDRAKRYGDTTQSVQEMRRNWLPQRGRRPWRSSSASSP